LKFAFAPVVRRSARGRPRGLLLFARGEHRMMGRFPELWPSFLLIP